MVIFSVSRENPLSVSTDYTGQLRKVSHFEVTTTFSIVDLVVRITEHPVRLIVRHLSGEVDDSRRINASWNSRFLYL